MKKNKSKRNKNSAFDIVIIVILALFSICCLYPFINILLTSFSTEADYLNSNILVIPRHFNIESYRYIFLEGGMLKSFGISGLVSICGVIYSMLLTSLGAYVLSKKRLPGQKIFFTMILITMFFGGGIIPFFFVLKSLKLYNSLLGLFIPFGISSYNMIVLRNFFVSVPDEVIESAKLDGASDFTILTRIVVPLSKAGFATIMLFYFVGFYNDWYWPMILIQNEDLYPLSLKLRNILSNAQATDYYKQINVDSGLLYSKGQDSASIIVSLIPILVIYPFVQKYFVKGVMLGSVKS